MMFHPTTVNSRKQLKGLEPLSLESYLAAAGLDLGHHATAHSKGSFPCRPAVVSRKDDHEEEERSLKMSIADDSKNWIADGEGVMTDCRIRVGHRTNPGPIDLTNKPDSNLERLKQQQQQLKPLQRTCAKSTAAVENKSLPETVLKRRRLAANARERCVHVLLVHGAFF